MASCGCAVDTKDVRKFDESVRQRAIEERFTGLVARIKVRAMSCEQPNHFAQACHLWMKAKYQRSPFVVASLG
jgi:hypothetical protein